MLYLILKAQMGNQLFQIMNIISISKEYNIDYMICCNKNEETIYEKKRTYFNNIYLKLKDKLKKIEKNELENNVENNLLYKENKFEYLKIDLNNLIKENKDIYIDGFFQSYKYFEKYKEEIYNIFEIKNIKNQLKNTYSYIFSKKTIAIHFRFGDYLYLQDYHPIQTIKYYYNSINKLNKILINNKENIVDYNFIFFCCISDNIIVNKYIDRLNTIYNNKLNFIKINDSISEWEQIIMISLCNHIIIANSTFSWWGAYFSENNKTTIIYPLKWFGPYYKNNSIKDLILENWIGIEDT